MEETVQDPVGSSADSSGTNEKKETKDVVAYDSYKKVLAEKKSQSDRLSQAEARLKEYEQRELESKGKYEELVNNLRKENSELKEGISKRDKAYVMSKVHGAIKTKAVAAGCLDADKLLRLIDNGKVESLQVNDRYEVDGKDVDFLLSEAQKENPFLFKKAKANVVDGNPVGAPVTKPGKKVSEMTNEEIEELYKASFKK